jgi:hypothetical protein
LTRKLKQLLYGDYNLGSCFFMPQILRKLIVSLLILNLSCVGKKILQTPTSFQAECLQGLSFGNGADEFLTDSLWVDFSLGDKFDDKTIDMAVSLHVMSELEKYVEEDLERTEKLELRSKIYGKITKMGLELQSLMAAIDCEEEKGEQIASFLEKEVRKKERNLTVAAIITGAAVGVGTGFILAANDSRNDWPEYLGIAGGLAEVFLGLSILRLERKISIHHPKNVLWDVYSSDTRPDYFPPSIWYYFNSHKNNEEGESLKKQLISRWEVYNLSDENLGIFFSNGGNYTAEMLKSRSEMLDQLEAQLGLINKDLLYFLNQMESLDSGN